MLQRIFPPLLWLAAHFCLVYVNKAGEQEAIGHGSSEASKPSFSHLNVSRLLFVSNMESPDRRKLSLFCWFNAPVAGLCAVAHREMKRAWQQHSEERLQHPRNRLCTSAGCLSPFTNTSGAGGGLQSAWFLPGRVCPNCSFHTLPCISLDAFQSE